VISSAWLKSGIYPFKPELVLSQISSTELHTSSESDSEPELALDVQTARRLTKKIYKEPGIVSKNVELLIKSIDTLILQNELLRRDNSQLNSVIISEKKHQNRPKPLGLLGDEDTKFGQFWSPVKIGLRRDEIKAKQEQDELEKRLAEEKKQEDTDNRQIRAQLERDRIDFNKSERIRKKAEKEAELVRKRHERELTKAIKTTQIKSKPVRLTL
jgi:hypothetical protein